LTVAAISNPLCSRASILCLLPSSGQNYRMEVDQTSLPLASA
jgi:hypothetical protein